jgi:hypothetical protein
MQYVNQHVSLSTSATAVGVMSSAFAANRGNDFTEGFSGTYTQGFAGFPINPCPVANCSATSLSFSFEPFLYDPNLGDLLLDVSGNGFFSEDHLFFQAGADRDVSSLELSGEFGNTPIVSIGTGLFTQCEFRPVVRRIGANGRFLSATPSAIEPTQAVAHRGRNRRVVNLVGKNRQRCVELLGPSRRKPRVEHLRVCQHRDPADGLLQRPH